MNRPALCEYNRWAVQTTVPSQDEALFWAEVLDDFRVVANAMRDELLDEIDGLHDVLKMEEENRLSMAAEVERLQCCGNCARYAAGHYHPCGHGYGRTLMCHERCQYDPSRWQPLEEQS